MLTIIYSLYNNLCSELCRLLGYILIRFMGLELSVIYFVCVFGCLNMSAALVWTSLDIPPDAFQIILERLNGLREVQTEQSERMVAMQDQLDVLSAKFDSIATHHEHWPFGHSDQKGVEVFFFFCEAALEGEQSKCLSCCLLYFFVVHGYSTMFWITVVIMGSIHCGYG